LVQSIAEYYTTEYICTMEENKEYLTNAGALVTYRVIIFTYATLKTTR